VEGLAEAGASAFFSSSFDSDSSSIVSFPLLDLVGIWTSTVPAFDFEVDVSVFAFFVEADLGSASSPDRYLVS
jgi:hypothetical protein